MQKIKIAHISDTHNDNSFEIPDCDIFIHSGDITNLGTKQEYDNFIKHLNSQSENIRKKFDKYFRKHIILGNHDNIDCFLKECRKGSDMWDVEGFVTLWEEGLTLHYTSDNKEIKGKMLSHPFAYSATRSYAKDLSIGTYNLVPTIPFDFSKQGAEKRKFLMDRGFKDGKWAFEKEDAERWKELDSLGYCDILVSHAPPTSLQGGKHDNRGCDPCVRDYILKYSPRYCFTGHVHELNGVYNINDTVVSVSHNTMRSFEIEI